MQNVLIVEGPDGSGKTEIGKALSKAVNAPYFKVTSEHDFWRSNKFKEALEFDQSYISQFLEQTGLSCTIDRAWPSEWVYSLAYERHTNERVLYEVDRRFASFGTTIILCRRRDYSHVTDELVENSMLQELDAIYNQFAKWTACKVVEIFVDDFDNDIEKQLPWLIERI